MPEKRNPFSSFPTKLKRSTQNPDVVYSLSTDFYGLKSAPTMTARSASPQTPTETPILTLSGDNGEAIQVFKGMPKQTRAMSISSTVTPVYSLGASGSMVVPTGRVFVRFDDNVNAESKSAEIKKLGYKIAKTLSYAPNAAWLEATNGGLVSALSNIEKLEKLENVQNVEPQLLGARAMR